jgi:hypothetical protein
VKSSGRAAKLARPLLFIFFAANSILAGNTPVHASRTLLFAVDAE